MFEILKVQHFEQLLWFTFRVVNLQKHEIMIFQQKHIIFKSSSSCMFDNFRRKTSTPYEILKHMYVSYFSLCVSVVLLLV